MVLCIVPNLAYKKGTSGKNGKAYLGHWFVGDETEPVLVEYYDEKPIAAMRMIKTRGHLYAKSEISQNVGTLKVINADVLKDLVLHLIVRSVLIVLRHFHVVVRDLDLAVVAEIIHSNVGISRTVRAYGVYSVFACDIITVSIGIFKEAVSSSAVFLVTREGRSTH